MHRNWNNRTVLLTYIQTKHVSNMFVEYTARDC